MIIHDLQKKQKLNQFWLLLFLSPLFIVIGCLDIEEDELSNPVELIAPGDSLITQLQTVTFAWNEIKDASSYELLIVEPTFNNISTIAQRTTTIDLDLEITLPEGSYQWKVTAINSISDIESPVRNLIVEFDSLSNGSNQRVALISPADEFSTNNTDVELLWSSLSGAISYDVEVASPVFGNSTFLILQDSTIQDFYNITIPEEGQYSWRVRAVFPNNVRTAFSSSTFNIDLSQPNPPRKLSPEEGELTSAPITIRWERDLDVIIDTLEIRRDSITGTQVLNQAYTSPQAIFTTPGTGDFLWRVRSKDAAGNLSDYSNWQSFELE